MGLQNLLNYNIIISKIVAKLEKELQITINDCIICFDKKDLYFIIENKKHILNNVDIITKLAESGLNNNIEGFEFLQIVWRRNNTNYIKLYYIKDGKKLLKTQKL